MDMNRKLTKGEEELLDMWLAPGGVSKPTQCSTCKYNDFNENGKAICKYFHCKRLQAPVDLYNCPEYEEKGDK